jgi:hypothetical protein
MKKNLIEPKIQLKLAVLIVFWLLVARVMANVMASQCFAYVLNNVNHY